jgi:predicted metal-dependent HD superfamily phosphohydrolase
VTVTFDRAAAFLAPRLWYAKVAGVLVWAAWVGSLAAGTSVQAGLGGPTPLAVLAVDLSSSQVTLRNDTCQGVSLAAGTRLILLSNSPTVFGDLYGVLPLGSSLVTDLASRWPLGTDLAEVRDQLLAAYATDRGYHDTRHLVEVLDRVDELAVGGEDFDRPAVELAAWFHDAVYDGHDGAEERSALWALDALAGRPVAEEVARLVRLTERHAPADDDTNGCAVSDADLAILAAVPARYAEYTADVRREYAHVPDDLFRAGRTAVLRDLLAKPTLFHTAHARREWEARARANVEAELAQL